MGAAFSFDFSPVRVHTGRAADGVASRLQANALTAGTDILFRSGAFNPGTQSGDRLLAHELAHVVQQAGGLARAPIDRGPSDRLERAAEVAADDVMRTARSEVAPVRGDLGSVRDDRVQRQAKVAPVLTRDEEIRLSRTSPGRATLDAGGSVLSLFNFAIDSAEPKPYHTALLGELARFLLYEVPVIARIRLTGHTDSTGPFLHNLELSRRRVDAVATVLGGAGVKAEVFWAGQVDPAADNDTVDGRSRNRRVDVLISPTPEPERKLDPKKDDGEKDFCDRYPRICDLGPIWWPPPLPWPWPLLCLVVPELCALLPCLITPKLCIPPPPGPDGPKPPTTGPSVIFSPVRALNTPAAMADRIPDQGTTPVMAAVAGWEPSMGPIMVRVRNAGLANGHALVNGAPEMNIWSSTVLAVGGTDQTSPRAGAFNLQLEAVLGGVVIGRGRPFAVVAVMENMSTSTGSVVVAPAGVSLFALMSKQTDGAAGLRSLGDMEYLEHLVVLEETGGMAGFGLGDFGYPVLADRDQLDEHGTPNERLRGVGRQKLLQVHTMIDHRTGSRDIPVTRSGFAVVREVMADPDRPGCLLLVVTKAGEAGTAGGFGSAAGAGYAEARVPLPCKPPEEEDGCGSANLPATVVTYSPGPHNEARLVTAEPLTRCPPAPPASPGSLADPRIYQAQFDCLDDHERLFWVAGHLLHGPTPRTRQGRHLHGPGDDRRNVVITTKSVNGQMAAFVERMAIQIVYDLKQTLWYEAEVLSYFPHAEFFAQELQVRLGTYDWRNRVRRPEFTRGTFQSERVPPSCPPTQLPPTPTPPVVKPPVVKPSTAQLPPDFVSTIKICKRVLTSRPFPIKKGGLAVTLDPDWSFTDPLRPGVCWTGISQYSVSLVRKGWLLDREVRTVRPRVGVTSVLIWTGLESGDYELIIAVPDHDPACCLTGGISVTTFDTP